MKHQTIGHFHSYDLYSNADGQPTISSWRPGRGFRHYLSPSLQWTSRLTSLLNTAVASNAVHIRVYPNGWNATVSNEYHARA
jgi:hypothetical protein